jgi:hypothetical protein
VDFGMSAGDVTMKPILQKMSTDRHTTKWEKSVASVAAADTCDTFLQFPSLIGEPPFSPVNQVWELFLKLFYCKTTKCCRGLHFWY